MRSLLALATALAILVVGTPRAGAITGHAVPDTTHTYVGLLVFEVDGVVVGACSGSLLAPRVFLTAGHCTAGATAARVYLHQAPAASFDAELGMDPFTGFPATCLPDDELCAAAANVHNRGFDGLDDRPNIGDVGIVLLDEPLTSVGFASLAAAGSLDPLATERGRQNVTFTISGYGASYVDPVRTEASASRLMATVRLVNLTSRLNGGFSVQTSAHPGGGRGGTCFGDSGGPVLHGGSSTIVAVTSFALNANCRGVDFGYRTDTPAVLAWIASIAASVGEGGAIDVRPIEALEPRG